MTLAPKIRPTYIYWLFDIRSETLVEHPNGYPFYCGKTVTSLKERLSAHCAASRKHPERLLSKFLNKCGRNVDIRLMAISPANENWSKQENEWIKLEQFWIHTLRLLWDETANILDGGASTAGIPRSTEFRKKVSESNRRRKGIKFSDEARANMSAARTGRKRAPFSDEHRSRLSAAAKRRSPEQRSKIGLLFKGKTLSPEHRAKVSAGLKGKKRGPYSAEHRAKISAGQRRRFQGI